MNFVQQLFIFYLRTKFIFLSAISKKTAARHAFTLFCTPPTRDRPPLPEIFLQSEKLHFDFENYSITGYRWNKGGTRKILILHGFESCAINFAAYIGPLLEKNYEVLAFDAPAHGRSSGKRITGLTYRDFVKYIHAQYGPVESYLAHSLGGFALCLAMAETPHDNNYRMALIAPATETSTAIDNFFKFLRLGDVVRKEFEKIITTISGHSISWFSITRAIEDISAKVIWYHDEDDRTTPLEDARHVMAKNHTGVEFVITKGLGHSRIYRNEKIIESVCEFL